MDGAVKGTAARRRGLPNWMSVSVAALLGLGLWAASSHAQESAPAISLFPAAETENRLPRSEPPALSDGAVVAGTAVATVLTLPHRAAACFVGNVVGFFAGPVPRVPLAPATAAGLLSAEGVDRVGRTFVEIGCADDWVVTEEQFRRWASSPGSP